MKLPKNPTFLARHNKVFWNISVLLRLETLIENYREKFNAKGITDLAGLLLALKRPPVKIPMVLSGVENLKHYQRQVLVDLCDPFAKERVQLTQEIRLLQRDKKNAENAPLSTLSELEKQKSKVNALHTKISELELKLHGLGARNTVPDNLYKYAETKDLVAQGFVMMQKGWPYPKFTERGWAVWATAQTISRHLNTTLNYNEASPELNNSTWQRMKALYIQGV